MSVNRGFQDDIELEETGKSGELPQNDYEEARMEKGSIDGSEPDSIGFSKKAFDLEPVIHDGPYAGNVKLY